MIDLKYFPNFIRAIYKSLSSESNETLMQIGEDFNEYLNKKITNPTSELKEAFDIDIKTVIRNLHHPFRTMGYHPALILHFQEFIKVMKAKAEKAI